MLKIVYPICCGMDDVFSDVFGKAASAITTRLLENPTEKITDVSVFRTK